MLYPMVSLKKVHRMRSVYYELLGIGGTVAALTREMGAYSTSLELRKSV